MRTYTFIYLEQIFPAGFSGPRSPRFHREIEVDYVKMLHLLSSKMDWRDSSIGDDVDGMGEMRGDSSRIYP